ncbi:MAG: hypothetical protein ACOY94_01375 [Bacillota bacterium]
MSLAALFVGAVSASRSWRNKFAELEASLPGGPDLVLGRYLAGVAGLMGLTLTPAFLAVLFGPASSLLTAVPEFLGQALIAVGFGLSVGWFLVGFLGADRWVYPLAAMCWLILAVVQRVFRGARLHVAELSLVDVMRLNFQPYTELWGYVQAGPLPLWFHVFYLGVAAALVTAVLWRYMSSRNRRFPAAVASLAVVALSVVALAGGRYVLLVSEWNEQGAAARVRFQEARREGGQPAAVIEDYDLTVDLRQSPLMKVEAGLTIRNTGRDPLTAGILTLNPDLKVTGASTGYRQTGSRLELTLTPPLPPGGTVQVQVRYAGAVWLPRDGLIPRAAYFTSASGAFLSGPAGWYPLSGHVGVTAEHPTAHPPASFRIRVESPENWTFVSNLAVAAGGEFRGRAITQAMIAGSPRLAVRGGATVTMVGSADDLVGVAGLAGLYEEAFLSFSRFFPDLAVNALTIWVADAGTAFPTSLPSGEGRPVLVISRNQLAHVGAPWPRGFAALGKPLIDELWRMGEGHPQGKVYEEVALYLWLHYQHKGDGGQIAQRIPKERYPYAYALHDLYAAQGREAVARALAKLRLHAGEVEQMGPESGARWIGEAGQ